MNINLADRQKCVMDVHKRKLYMMIFVFVFPQCTQKSSVVSLPARRKLGTYIITRIYQEWRVARDWDPDAAVAKMRGSAKRRTLCNHPGVSYVCMYPSNYCIFSECQDKHLTTPYTQHNCGRILVRWSPKHIRDLRLEYVVMCVKPFRKRTSTVLLLTDIWENGHCAKGKKS